MQRDKNEKIENLEEFIEDLCIERTMFQENLSHLSEEEKKKRFKKRSKELNKQRNFKLGNPGGHNEVQFTKKLYKSMKWDSKMRNHEPPKITEEELLEMLETDKYVIDTDIGKIELPMKITNGYFNSASPDRIDNEKGYFKENIRIIPLFLNVNDKRMSKINHNDWNEIVKIRENPRNPKELIEIAQNLNNSAISKTFFYQLAHSACNHSKQSGGWKIFGFRNHQDFFIFLIEKFIEQGGRCAYLKIPIYPEVFHKYKASVERLNVLKGYTKENTILILSSLNSKPAYQQNLNDEQKQKAVELATVGFNIDKLDSWSLLVEKRKKRVENLIRNEKCILENEIDLKKLKLQVRDNRFKKTLNIKLQMNVKLLDQMGTDLTVVNAARCSFGKKKEFFDESDEKLIRYLAKHNHWTPFGHCTLQFYIKCPLFVARQLGKHQVGLVWNEISRRYYDSEPEFYIPDEWRLRAKNIKQGSSDKTVEYDISEHTKSCLNTYNDMLEQGIAPEMARMILPQNTMTEFWWSGSLAAFARICKLRCATDTQKETRHIANEIDKLCTQAFPVCWKYLREN